MYGSEYGDPATVSLVRLGLEFELTLQEVLDKYGPPEKFQAARSELPFLVGGHGPGIIVSLLYPKRGLAFEIWLLGLRPARLDPNTTLKAVLYFTPTSMERLFMDVTEMRIFMRGDTWKELQDWQGLGPISEVH